MVTCSLPGYNDITKHEKSEKMLTKFDCSDGGPTDVHARRPTSPAVHDQTHYYTNGNLRHTW